MRFLSSLTLLVRSYHAKCGLITAIKDWAKSGVPGSALAGLSIPRDVDRRLSVYESACRSWKTRVWGRKFEYQKQYIQQLDKGMTRTVLYIEADNYLVITDSYNVERNAGHREKSWMVRAISIWRWLFGEITSATLWPSKPQTAQRRELLLHHVTSSVRE